MKTTIGKFMLSCVLVLTSGIAMAQLNFNTHITHVTCHSGNDATISVDITSGQKGNLIVQWENDLTKESDLVVVKGAPSVVKFPNDGQKRLPISGGEYVITVVDASDVKSIDSKTTTLNVNEPASIEINVVNPTKGAANGEIRVRVINPDNFYAYQFSIDNGENYQASPIFKNLTAQTYTLTVTITSDNTNCQKSYSVDLNP